MISNFSVQEPGSKEPGNRNLSIPCHVQLPDFWDGNDQYREIRNNIEDSSSLEHCVSVETGRILDKWVPYCFSRRTLDYAEDHDHSVKDDDNNHSNIQSQIHW